MDNKTERFDDYLDQIHEEYSMGWITFRPSQILKDCDPVAYRIAMADWEDWEDEEDDN